MPIYTMSGARSNHPGGVELTVVEDAATHVVEITGDDSMLVCIVEQVAVDLAAFGLTLDDLVAMAGATTGDVPVLGADGLWRAGPAVPQLAGHNHTQLVVDDTWVVDHLLGRHPVAWALYDTTGALRCEYHVEHPTLNRSIVRMDVPTAGTIEML